ncbi:MAG: hypothetical protein ACRDKV_07775 [Solirubrobacterales bacterium]
MRPPKEGAFAIAATALVALGLVMRRRVAATLHRSSVCDHGHNAADPEARSVGS